AIPFVFLLAGLWGGESDHWRQVLSYMLPTYLRETALVVGGSAGLAAAIGVALAWCVGLHDFPGRKAFEVVLLLPLSIPSYIAAYTYDGLLGYTGFFQATLRNRLGIDVNAYGFSAPRLACAIFIFAVTLYPYIYIFALTYLRNHGASMLESATLLGGGRARILFLVVLPLLRPSLVAGGTLVCLEVLNDYGVTSHFGVHTFTTAIFAAWFGMGEAASAVRLALMLLAAVLLLILASKALQKAGRYHLASGKEKGSRPRRLDGLAAAGAFSFCLAVAAVCFLIPVGQMLAWARMSWEAGTVDSLAPPFRQTLFVAGVATAIIMALSAATAVAGHASPGRGSRLAAQAAGMGYAIPAAVLAIGAVMLFAGIDKAVARFAPGFPGAPLGMTICLLLYAYVVRFFSIGYQAIEGGYLKMGRLRSEASRTLGRGPAMTFLLVELPLLGNAMIGGSILVFVDIIKELPLTLILRPFNFNTLGTRVYELAHNEAIPETSLPALAIVVIGAAFVAFMRLWDKRGES
ncbi:MAG: iron ABC transporter permease, partial [Planctomycetota bacterium]|nr:iron ABC transporter permease [Planctomycetota bacterium]